MRITFTVGKGLDKNSMPISATEADKAQTGAMIALCQAFGGCTVVESMGGWMNGDKLVVERGLQFTVESATKISKARIEAFARNLRIRFRQSCVAVSVQRSEFSFV